jgi:nucleotide-binding universal stress UspA family protein
MQSVVIGYDGSEASGRALDRAAVIARGEARVTVVTAVPFRAHAGGRSMGAIDEREELAEERATLDQAKARLETQGIHVTAVEGEGDPADVIIEAAKQADADLVVVGTRGHGTTKRLMLGSVSTKVVHEAPCDVLVVR